MIINYKFKPDTTELLSWEELNIGDVYYHNFTKNVCIKISPNGYLSFTDKKYHTRSKILQGSKSKVYNQIKADFKFEL